jgi:hypothetical protein
VSRGRLVSAVSVTRSQELAAIDAHIELYGVRRYPARYADETMAYLPMRVAASRLAEMQVQAPAGYAELLHRLLTVWRGRR